MHHGTLTLRGYGPPSNLTGTRLTKKFPSFCGNRRSLTYPQQPATHNCPTPDESTTNPSFISCDIVAPFFQRLGFRRGVLPCKNSDENVISTYNILNSFYIPHRSILLIKVAENKNDEHSKNAILSIFPSLRHIYLRTASLQQILSM